MTVHGGPAGGVGGAVAEAHPYYSAENPPTPPGTCSNATCAPRLLGVTSPTPREVRPRAPVRGHPHGQSGLEMAVWDDLVRAPAGAPSRRTAVVGGTIGRRSPPVYRSGHRRRAARRSGSPSRSGRVPARSRSRSSPGWDVGVVARCATHSPTAADGRRQRRLHPRRCRPSRRLDAFDLTMIEQPLDEEDLRDHARAAGAPATPICLDESIVTPSAARAALDRGACRIVNIKPGRLGGFASRSRRRRVRGCGAGVARRDARERHRPRAQHPPRLAAELHAARRHRGEPPLLQPDLIEPPIEVATDGTIPVPTGPGIGVSIVDGAGSERDRAATVAGGDRPREFEPGHMTVSPGPRPPRWGESL